MTIRPRFLGRHVSKVGEGSDSWQILVDDGDDFTRGTVEVLSSFRSEDAHVRIAKVQWSRSGQDPVKIQSRSSGRKCSVSTGSVIWMCLNLWIYSHSYFNILVEYWNMVMKYRIYPIIKGLSRLSRHLTLSRLGAGGQKYFLTLSFIHAHCHCHCVHVLGNI